MANFEYLESRVNCLKAILDELENDIEKASSEMLDEEIPICNCSNCANNIEFPPPHTCDVCTSLDQEDDYSMWQPKE